MKKYAIAAATLTAFTVSVFAGVTAQDRAISNYLECVVGKAAGQYYRLIMAAPQRGLPTEDMIADARQFAYANCKSQHPKKVKSEADLQDIISDRLNNYFIRDIGD